MIDHERERRRSHLFSLVSEFFGNDYVVVASVIRQITSKPVTVRTIQTWLAMPDKKSCRNTPEWAIRALEDYINRPGNRSALKESVAEESDRNRGRAKSPRELSHEVQTRMAVDLADTELMQESREKSQWIELAGRALGESLYQHLSSLRRELDALSTRDWMLREAIRACSSIEELRAHLKEAETCNALSELAIRKNKEALRAGAEEFGDDEGLATGKSA